MNVRFIILLCIASCLCCACVPTTQIRYYRKHGDIRITPGDIREPLLVNLRTPALRRSAKGEIDTTASFARNSRGQQFRLAPAIVPFMEYYPEPSYFLSRELRLVSSEGVPRNRWPNGDWHLHIELLSPRGREIYEADFNLHFSLWTPFLGPPL